ncbi:CheR family methyltransferase [Deferribacter abyssi]|uniref:CheR family methyltransferase n=1 Tax=Deferribacter abyssi TaxID=213806 RepID=UPI003C14E09B
MNNLFTNDIKSLIKNFAGLNITGPLEEKFRETINKWLNTYKNEENIYNILLKDKSALYKFLSDLTINESFFYRNKSQFTILKSLIEHLKNNKAINIISIGCANGCEPYTIAIEILESLPEYKDKINILGIDISEQALNEAKKGIYQKWYLRNTDNRLIEKYFDKIDDKSFKLKNYVKTLVNFSKENLFDLSEDTYHIIYCRNLLIYLDKNEIELAIKTIDKIAEENAFIIFGTADILLIPKNFFKREEVNGVVVFRKKEAPAITTKHKITHLPLFTDIKIRKPRDSKKEETDLFEKGIQLISQDRPKEALNYFSMITNNINPSNLRAKIFSALCLIKLHDYENAKNLLDTIIKNEPLNYETFLLIGIYYYLHNDYLKALENFRKSLFLKGESVSGWYYYALCMKNLGENLEAKKGFEKALYFLENSDESIEFFLGEITRDSLKNIINIFLRNL